MIILMPGWGDIASYNLRFPLLARRCNRAGFNAATLVAPYHFQRRPRQRGMFHNGDLYLLAESAALRSRLGDQKVALKSPKMVPRARPYG